MNKLVSACALMLFPVFANAAWLNASGTVRSLNNYAHTDTILVRLSVDGAPVEACSSTEYFAIDGNLPENRRNQLYTALLTAKTANKPITIAYDSTGNCIAYSNNPSAYRGVLRIIH